MTSPRWRNSENWTSVPEKQVLVHQDGTELSSLQDKEDLLPRWQEQQQSVQQSSPRDKFINIQCILLNTITTVTIVFLNKIVFSDEQLGKCQISIAAWHFTATAIVLYLATRAPFQAFPAVRLPIGQMISISAFFAGFLLLGNLSLAFNDVGFYQLAKIMTTPTVVFLNFVLFRITVSRPTLLSVLTVCMGVGLVTTTVVLSNPIGTFIASAAFTVTALYQIWIGKKIADLDVSPPQLLLNQAPVSVALLMVFIPFVDTMPDLSIISSRVLWTVFGSGILASLLNLSQFLIIGRTSALTFNVISQLKTIIIVGLSWYSEGRALTAQDCVGVALALGGAYSYSTFAGKKK